MKSFSEQNSLEIEFFIEKKNFGKDPGLKKKFSRKNFGPKVKSLKI